MTMTDQTARIDGLKADIAEVRVPEPAADREDMLLKVGLVLPAVGVVLLALTWYQASGSRFVTDQIPMLISGGLGGLALILIGVGLWVRFSVARLLRVWLARDLVEQQAQADRVVEALNRIESALQDRS